MRNINQAMHRVIQWNFRAQCRNISILKETTKIDTVGIHNVSFDADLISNTWNSLVIAGRRGER